MPNVQAGALWWAIRARDQGLKAALKSTENSLRSYRTQVKRTQRELQQTAARTRRLAGSFLSLSRVISIAAGTAGLGLFVRRLAQSADIMTLAESRIKLVTQSTLELRSAQNQLFIVAQKTGGAFEQTVNLYARVARATKSLGIEQSQVIKFVRAINESLVISGATSAEAANGLIQLSQGIASNRLGGDELRSTLEQLPRIGIALADALGITLGQVREIGHQGGLTARVVLGAIVSQAANIAREFQVVERTVQRAFTELNNQYLQFVHNLNRGTQGTRSLIAAIDGVRQLVSDPAFQQASINLLGGIISTTRTLIENFKVIAATIGGIYLIRVGLFIRRTALATFATEGFSRAVAGLSRIVGGEALFNLGSVFTAAGPGADFAAQAQRASVAKAAAATRAATELQLASRRVVQAQKLEITSSAAAAAATRRTSRRKIAEARKAAAALTAALAVEDTAKARSSASTQAANLAKIRSNRAAALSAQSTAASETLAANATRTGLLGRFGGLVAAHPGIAAAAAITGLAIALDRYVASARSAQLAFTNENEALNTYKQILDDAVVSTDSANGRVRDLRNTVKLLTLEAIKFRQAASDAVTDRALRSHLEDLDKRYSSLARSAADAADRLSLTAEIAPDRQVRPEGRNVLRELQQQQQFSLLQARQRLSVAGVASLSNQRRLQATFFVINRLTKESLSLQEKLRKAQLDLTNAAGKEKQTRLDNVNAIKEQIADVNKAFSNSQKLIADKEKELTLLAAANFILERRKLIEENIANIRSSIATGELVADIGTLPGIQAFEGLEAFQRNIQADFERRANDAQLRLDLATKVSRVDAELRHRIENERLNLESQLYNAKKLTLTVTGNDLTAAKEQVATLKEQLRLLQSRAALSKETIDAAEQTVRLEGQANDAEKERVSLARQFSKALNDGLSRSISSAKTLNDVFRSIATNIALALFQAGLNALVNSIFPASAAGVDGARQHGGPVRKGGSYFVGERGKEAFVPETDGRIVPNSQLRMNGPGATVTIAPNISIRATDAGVRQIIAEELAPVLENFYDSVEKTVETAISRPSGLRSVLSYET